MSTQLLPLAPIEAELAGARANAETWRECSEGWSRLFVLLVGHCREVTAERDQLRDLLRETDSGTLSPISHLPSPNHCGVPGVFPGPIAINTTGEEP